MRKASVEYEFIWANPHGACEPVDGLSNALLRGLEDTCILDLLPPDERGVYVLEISIRPKEEAEGG